MLYSNMFQELQQSGANIVLFLKDNDMDYYRDRFDFDNVTLEPILYDQALTMLKKNMLSRLFVLARFLMSGRSGDYENTTREVFSYLYGVEMSRSLSEQVFFLFVRALAAAGRASRTFRRLLARAEELAFPGSFYNRYFEAYRPKMLVTSSVGYMIDPYFMRAAKRHQCKVISVLHSWDNPTTKGYRGGDPDYAVAWNDIMKKEISVFHDIPEDKIFIGGIAHWDAYFDGRFKPGPKDAFLKLYGFREDRKTIMYGTSSPVLFRRTFDVIEQLLVVMENDGLNDPAQLLVRLHPSYLLKGKGGTGQVIAEYRGRIEALEMRFSGLVKFAFPKMKMLNDDIDMPLDDMLHLGECLVHSTVLLTEYSTLMIEGAVFDCPVINVALYNFRDTDKPISYLENFTHIKRVLAPGAVRNAYDFEELKEHIDAYLADPSLDREKRQKLVNQEITHNKGCAGKAIARHIARLLERE